MARFKQNWSASESYRKMYSRWNHLIISFDRLKNLQKGVFLYNNLDKHVNDGVFINNINNTNKIYCDKKITKNKKREYWISNVGKSWLCSFPFSAAMAFS